MKNTSSLTSKDFEEIKIDARSVDELEDTLIKEHLGQVKIETNKKEDLLIRSLLESLSMEKSEGETGSDFSKRVKEDTFKLLDIDY